MRIEIGEHLRRLHQRQPLLVGGLLFLAGLYLGYAVLPGDWRWMAVGLLLCVLLLLVRRRRGEANGPHVAGILLVALGSLFLGMGRAAWDRAGREEECGWLACGETKTTATLSCTIGPDVVSTPIKGETVRYSFKGVGASVQTTQGDQALTYLPLTVNWYAGVQDKERAPKAGEQWRFRGRLTFAKARRSPLTVATFTTGQGATRSRRLSTPEASVWFRRLALVRREAMRRLALGIEDWPVAPALIQAMLLGCSSEMPAAMRRIFSDSGTIHVFAVSGLHIAFVVGLLVLLAGMTGLKRRNWFFLVAPLLIGYTVMTGARPSAIRACLMALFVFLAPLVGRRPTMLSALTATAWVVHLWRPAFIFDVGSVLSFAVMAGLIAFMGPFCTFFQSLFGCVRLKRYEEMLRVAGSTRRAAWIHRGAVLLRFSADAFAVSLAAFLASVPLTGYYFGRFTPGGLLANLVIAPCAGLIVVSGALGLSTSFLHPWLATTFNHAAAFLTMVMVRVADWAASTPGLSFNTGKWSPWQVALWLAGLAGLAAWIGWRSNARDGLAWLTEEGNHL